MSTFDSSLDDVSPHHFTSVLSDCLNSDLKRSDKLADVFARNGIL